MEALRSEAGSEDALHDRRVASRRLRALAALVAPWADSEHVTKASQRLKGLTRALGVARGWDVHRTLLRTLRGQAVHDLERAALEHADALAERARRKAEKKLLEEASPKDVKQAEKAVETLLEAFHTRFESSGLSGGAWAYLQPRVHAGFGPLEPLSEREDSDLMHQARTVLKELRYGLEWLGPTFHGDLEMWLNRIKTLQDALGLHHDWVVLSQWLEALRLQLAAEGRSALASGLAQIRPEVQAHREKAFHQFQMLVPKATVNELAQDLWMSLGPWET
jgi:CHAD domain-containing protein